MEIGVRDLRNRTARVIDAVKAGERVVLTVNGEPTADIVPHGERARWLSGTALREQLADRAADPALGVELDSLPAKHWTSLSPRALVCSTPRSSSPADLAANGSFPAVSQFRW